MKQKFVAQHDIDRVLGGLQKYFQRMVETKTFSAVDMKNLMEPIFTEAGYRQETIELNDAPNVLVLHCNAGVGDFVLMSPGLRALRRIYERAHITLIVNEKSGNLAELCPYVDELILNAGHYDWRNFFAIYQWNAELAKKLLLRRYDLAFPMCVFPSAILLSYMGGTKKILGFTPTSKTHFLEPFGNEVYRPLLVEMPRTTPKLNVNNGFSNYMSVIDGIVRYPTVNREGELWLSAGDRAFARDRLSTDLSNDRKVYVICMGGSAPRKQWQAQNYAKLAQRIAEQEPDIKFVIVGGGQIDAQYAEVFKSTVDEKFYAAHVLDMTNKSTYRQTGAILELADMYIGNDTSTLHMAAATKAPVLTPNCFSADHSIPFERSVPAGCYPWHVPSVTVMSKHALPECKDSTDHYGCAIAQRPHCITQITVETMFDAYHQLLARIADNNIEPLFIS